MLRNAHWLGWGTVLLATLLGAAAASATSGLVGIRQVEQEIQDAARFDVPRLITITHARKAFRNLVLLERELLLARDNTEVASSTAQIDAFQAQLHRELSHYEELMAPEDKAEVAELRSAWESWAATHKKLRELYLSSKPEQARALAPPTVGMRSWDKTITTLVVRNEERMMRRGERALQVRAAADKQVYAATGVASLAAIALGGFALARIRRGVRDLNQLNANLDRLVEERTEALHRVLDSTGDGIVPVGPDGQIQEGWSSAITEWYGPLHAPHPLVWDYLQLGTSSQERELHRALTSALSSTSDKAPPPMTGHIQRAERTLMWELRINRGKDHERIALLIVLRDASAEFSAERIEAIHQQQKMESLGQLAAGVAHDFNNLLTVIIGQTDLLLLDNASEEDKESLGTIRDTTKRATALVSRLLSFARSHSSAPSPTSAHSIIDNAVWLMKHTLGRGISIQTSLEATRDTIIANPSHMESAFLNLGVNARDAMGGSGTIRIESSNCELDEEEATRLGLRPGSYLRLSFSDTGPGIPEPLRERVFHPFFTTKPEGKGTGLGLSSVQRTLIEHNGSIELARNPATGATFLAYLPLTDQPSVIPTEASRSR